MQPPRFSIFLFFSNHMLPNKSNKIPMISCSCAILLVSNILDKGSSAPCSDNKQQKLSSLNSNINSTRLATRISNKVASDRTSRVACCRAISNLGVLDKSCLCIFSLSEKPAVQTWLVHPIDYHTQVTKHISSTPRNNYRMK